MTTYVMDDADNGGGGGPDAVDPKKMDASITESLSGGQYTVRVNGSDKQLRVISADSKGMEFLLDGAYHKVRYLSRSTRDISMAVDGVLITLGAHAELDDIVYKNSGGVRGSSGASGGASAASLKSQIPGKVVSISVSAGDAVQKGDVICTLESMKMQVGVKAHKAGTVSSIAVAESDTVAKGDVIAEIE